MEPYLLLLLIVAPTDNSPCTVLQDGPRGRIRSPLFLVAGRLLKTIVFPIQAKPFAFTLFFSSSLIAGLIRLFTFLSLSSSLVISSLYTVEYSLYFLILISRHIPTSRLRHGHQRRQEAARRSQPPNSTQIILRLYLLHIVTRQAKDTKVCRGYQHPLTNRGTRRAQCCASITTRRYWIRLHRRQQGISRRPNEPKVTTEECTEGARNTRPSHEPHEPILPGRANP